MASLLRIKNWEQFQHYNGPRGETSLPWIRLYRGLLQDYGFQQLDDAQRWHLIGLWLLAAGNTPRGTIVADARFLQRAIGATEKIDLNALIAAGWLLADAASTPASTEETPMLAAAASTEERRVEKKREEYSSDFETAWAAYPARPGNSKKAAYKAWLARLAEGVSSSVLIAATVGYQKHTLLKGTLPEFVLMGQTFFGPNERYAAYLPQEPAPQAPEIALYDEQGNPTEYGRSLGL